MPNIRKRPTANLGRMVLCTLLASGLVAAASAQDIPQDLVGVWKVESISGNPADPGIRAWLEFEDAGTLGGSGGCNSLFGPYGNDGGFRIGPLAATRKSCPPDVLIQEQALLKAIRTVRDFRLQSKNQELQLLNGTGEEIIRLSADK